MKYVGNINEMVEVTMKRFLTVLLPLAVTVGSAACASAPPPAARAAGVERTQCDSTAASQDEVVRSMRVLSVKPLYTHVRSNNTFEDRVNGAKLIVRPPQGMTAEQMTRALQCHSARVLLGQEASKVQNDPYSLPDRWVTIEVEPEDGNFAVTISAETVRDNLQVYGRANHYADDHMVATDPGL
jgi:hypothetical protein